MSLDSLPPIWMLALAFPAVAAGYAVFAFAGFGAVFITAPALAQVMPVSVIVPVLALVDCAAATFNGFKLGKKVAFSELRWLIPLMVLGSLVGVRILLLVPARPMMAGLGVFILCYATYSLLAPPAEVGIRRRWVLPFGAFGGIFSGMFGSGGFIYAIYLSRRLADKDAIRATQSALIIFSAATRVVIFIFAGVYADLHILLLALTCVPAMMVGTWIGHHVTLRMSRDQFLRAFALILIFSGFALVLRAWLGKA